MKTHFFYYDWKTRFCVFCVYYFGRKTRLCNFGGKIFLSFAILIEKLSFAVLVRKLVLRGFCMNFCVVLTEKRNYLVLKANPILQFSQFYFCFGGITYVFRFGGGLLVLVYLLVMYKTVKKIMAKFEPC